MLSKENTTTAVDVSLAHASKMNQSRLIDLRL